MKKLLLLFVALATSLMTFADHVYELSLATGISSKSDSVTWTFNNGFTITQTAGKKYLSSLGQQNCLKYSAGVQYTIHIPDGIGIKYVKMTGYDNYTDDDAYLAELNGTVYSPAEYTWPKKTSSTAYVMATNAITLNSLAENALTFTTGGKQLVLKIYLYDYVPKTYSNSADLYSTPTRQMEKLTRGVVVVPAKEGGKLISWRYLGTDPYNTTFDVIKDGEIIAADLKNKTNYVNKNDYTYAGKYQIVTKVDGQAVETSYPVTSWTNIYNTIQLDRPAGGSNTSGSYTYTPNDMSAADVDGDGEYELIVKWDPSDSKDNSQSGITGNVYLDCYKLDGTKLWRVDLGANIRAGAHYTQFQVFDYDGDGKAEMICKTAPGSIDGTGTYVTEAADDNAIKTINNKLVYRNSNGYILSGPEYLTVFNGETGAAIHTIWYNPNRGFTTGKAASYGSWGDSYGNRGDRFLACTAYLDGPDANPSAVFCRGYYTRAYLWAVDFDGSKLSTKWLHSSISSSEWDLTDANGNTTKHTGLSATGYGNGNHNLSVADVDADGKDEIIYGSSAFDHDGSLLYSTGLGHGDAMHISDLMPDRPGYEVHEVHEEKPYGMEVHDAATGDIIWSMTGDADTGRGMAADVDSLNRGFEIASTADGTLYSCEGTNLGSRNSLDFRIYWDGDLQDELFDGKYNSTNGCAPIIQKYNYSTKKMTTLLAMSSYGKPQTCNTTKATPCLQADLFGDWREELVMWDYDDPGKIHIYETNIPTEYRVPTLMHDHVYRMGIAWQNSAYNQPPHLGYYLPDYIKDQQKIITGIDEISNSAAEDSPNAPIYNLAGQKVGKDYKGIVIRNGKKYVQK